MRPTASSDCANRSIRARRTHRKLVALFAINARHRPLDDSKALLPAFPTTRLAVHPSPAHGSKFANRKMHRLCATERTASCAIGIVNSGDERASCALQDTTSCPRRRNDSYRSHHWFATGLSARTVTALVLAGIRWIEGSNLPGDNDHETTQSRFGIACCPRTLGSRRLCVDAYAGEFGTIR
jgi:hypothetical protein